MPCFTCRKWQPSAGNETSLEMSYATKIVFSKKKFVDISDISSKMGTPPTPFFANQKHQFLYITRWFVFSFFSFFWSCHLPFRKKHTKHFMQLWETQFFEEKGLKVTNLVVLLEVQDLINQSFDACWGGVEKIEKKKFVDVFDISSKMEAPLVYFSRFLLKQKVRICYQKF